MSINRRDSTQDSRFSRPGNKPWHSVPVYEGRDLARTDLWELSLALARSKREIARNPLRLPKARRASVSILTAAITSLTPSLALAHSGSSSAAARGQRLTLTMGDRGSQVRKLQRLLHIEADGIFGRGTLRAVRLFQRSHALTADGIVGLLTWKALSPDHASAVGSGGGRELRLGDQGGGVASVQRLLGVPDDGIFGRQTRKAVRAFQRQQGLTVDGIVGPITRAALERGADQSAASVLELGDRGPAVADIQRALGLAADGIFGKRTLNAVRAFQRKQGLIVDGIVGPATREALRAPTSRRSSGSQHTHDESAATASRSDVDSRLNRALGLAEAMGLRVISAHRAGATVAGSGGRSDHSYMPSKAIDVQGTKSQMTRYAREVAGLANIETVIFSPVGIWISGHGWGEIHSSVTYSDHLGHVHVDTF